MASLFDHLGTEISFGLVAQAAAAVAIGYHIGELTSSRGILPGVLVGFFFVVLDVLILRTFWGRHRDVFRTLVLVLLCLALALVGLSFMLGPFLVLLGYHLPLG